MKYPIYRQDNHYSCGAYCIQMLLKYHHIQEEVKNIKENCKLTPAGISVYGMIQCLQHYNVEAKAYQCTIENIIEEIKEPCIIHTIQEELAHYMVLYKIHKGIAIIGDPDKGLLKISIEQLSAIFSGVCICINHVGRTKVEKKYYGFYSFILHHIKEKHQSVIKVVIYSLLISILSVIGSFYFQILLDTIKSMDFFIIVIVTIVFIILMSVKLFLNYSRKEFTIYLKKELDEYYVCRTIKNMVYLPLRYFMVNQEGVLLNKIQNLYQLSEFFIAVYTTVFMDGIFILVILIGLLYLDITISIFVLIMLGSASLLCYKYLQHINATNKELLLKYDSLQQTILEFIFTIFTTYQYHQKRFMKNKIGFRFQEYQQQIVKREQIFNILHNGMEGILQGFLFIVVIMASYLYKQSQISVGEIILFYMLTSYLIEPLLRIISLCVEKEEMILIFERYKDLLPNKKEKKKKISKITSMTLDHISYSYGYSKPIFEFVDLSIDHSIWLKGEVGSGKTTILQLLMGYDEVLHGQVLINGINIKQIDLDSLYQRMIYVTKQPTFFNESLQFNLLGNSEYYKPQLLELMELFNINELIPRLEETIDKEGSFLSSGQQQVLMLIKAIIKKPDILIIDEGLSNMDEKTARKILVYLHTVLKDTIVILVSHQTNIVNVKYDCVIMKNGNITYGE